ncbi:MAG: hypothetical protein COC00_011145 [Rhizobiales bacterium]|nr:hypothetical protein [Hyphomicrobiales bacterium]
MNSIISLVVLIMLGLTLQSCSTTNASNRVGAIDVINTPSGTIGCIAPKIISENGICKTPDKLSWE